MARHRHYTGILGGSNRRSPVAPAMKNLPKLSKRIRNHSKVSANVSALSVSTLPQSPYVRESRPLKISSKPKSRAKQRSLWFSRTKLRAKLQKHSRIAETSENGDNPKVLDEDSHLVDSGAAKLQEEDGSISELEALMAKLNFSASSSSGLMGVLKACCSEKDSGAIGSVSNLKCLLNAIALHRKNVPFSSSTSLRTEAASKGSLSIVEKVDSSTHGSNGARIFSGDEGVAKRTHTSTHFQGSSNHVTHEILIASCDDSPVYTCCKPFTQIIESGITCKLISYLWSTHREVTLNSIALLQKLISCDHPHMIALDERISQFRHQIYAGELVLSGHSPVAVVEHPSCMELPTAGNKSLYQRGGCSDEALYDTKKAASSKLSNLVMIADIPYGFLCRNSEKPAASALEFSLHGEIQSGNAPVLTGFGRLHMPAVDSPRKKQSLSPFICIYPRVTVLLQLLLGENLDEVKINQINPLLQGYGGIDRVTEIFTRSSDAKLRQHIAALFVGICCLLVEADLWQIDVYSSLCHEDILNVVLIKILKFFEVSCLDNKLATYNSFLWAFFFLESFRFTKEPNISGNVVDHVPDIEDSSEVVNPNSADAVTCAAKKAHFIPWWRYFDEQVRQILPLRLSSSDLQQENTAGVLDGLRFIMHALKWELLHLQKASFDPFPSEFDLSSGPKNLQSMSIEKRFEDSCENFKNFLSSIMENRQNFGCILDLMNAPVSFCRRITSGLKNIVKLEMKKGASQQGLSRMAEMLKFQSLSADFLSSFCSMCGLFHRLWWINLGKPVYVGLSCNNIQVNSFMEIRSLTFKFLLKVTSMLMDIKAFRSTHLKASSKTQSSIELSSLADEIAKLMLRSCHSSNTQTLSISDYDSLNEVQLGLLESLPPILSVFCLTLKFAPNDAVLRSLMEKMLSHDEFMTFLLDLVQLDGMTQRFGFQARISSERTRLFALCLLWNLMYKKDFHFCVKVLSHYNIFNPYTLIAPFADKNGKFSGNTNVITFKLLCDLLSFGDDLVGYEIPWKFYELVIVPSGITCHEGSPEWNCDGFGLRCLGDALHFMGLSLIQQILNYGDDFATSIPSELLTINNSSSTLHEAAHLSPCLDGLQLAKTTSSSSPAATANAAYSLIDGNRGGNEVLTGNFLSESSISKESELIFHPNKTSAMDMQVASLANGVSSVSATDASSCKTQNTVFKENFPSLQEYAHHQLQFGGNPFASILGRTPLLSEKLKMLRYSPNEAIAAIARDIWLRHY